MLGKAYLEDKEYNYAEKILNKLITLSGDTLDSRFLLGITYSKMNNYQKAFIEADRLIKAYPTNEHGYLLYAIINFEKKDYNRAEQWYNQARDKSPNSQLLRKYNIPLLVERFKNK